MRAVIAFVLLAWPVAAQAYRPFDGTDADVAAWREFEFEIGAFGYVHRPGQDALVEPALIANYGLRRDLELVLEGRELLLTDHQPGASSVQLVDTQLDLKWVVREGALQDAGGPSVALEFTALLPETGDTTPGAELAAIVSQRWDALTVHWNGAVALTREQNLGLFGSLIVEGPSRWPVRPVAEGFVESGDDVTEISGLVGAIWRFRDDLSFDAAFRVSQLESQTMTSETVTEVRAGLTWAICIGHHEPEPQPSKI